MNEPQEEGHRLHRRKRVDKKKERRSALYVSGISKAQILLSELRMCGRGICARKGLAQLER